MTDRLAAQIAFLTEADKLKAIERANSPIGMARRENSAEHSWHVMLYALVLAEYAAEPVDIAQVLTMLMLHDIVEIDAGDAPLHGEYDAAALAEAEAKAADRLFGLLPPDLGDRLKATWHEFEAAESPEARFAKAIDRTQTPIANILNGGGTWADYSVDVERAEAKLEPAVSRGAPTVWGWLQRHIRAFFAGEPGAGRGA